MSKNITPSEVSKIISKMTAKINTYTNDCIEYRLGYIRALYDIKLIDYDTAHDLIKIVQEIFENQE